MHIMKIHRCLAALLLSVSVHATEVAMKTDSGTLKGSIEEVGESKSSIVFIHPGSGPTDRDGNSSALPGKNNSLKYLAEALKQEKIPSLRIDKRGIGASAPAGMAEKDLRFETYITDTMSWVKWLKQRGYQNVIVLGHSEGSTIGMVAAQDEEVAAYVSIAGPARSADQVLLEQLRPKLTAHPTLLKQCEETISQLKQGKQVAPTPPGLDSLFRASVQPYMISWFKYDPSIEITKVNKPILILQGNTDRQIPVSAAKQLHTKAPTSKLVVIEGMNHVLKDAKGSISEQLPSYSDPKLPINGKLTKALVTFFKELP